jgi:hypothetical protein
VPVGHDVLLVVNHIHLCHQRLFVGKVLSHIVEQGCKGAFQLRLSVGLEERVGQIKDGSVLKVNGLISRTKSLFPLVFQKNTPVVKVPSLKIALLLP